MSLAPQDVRTFFVTSVTASRRRLFQVAANAELSLDVLKHNQVQQRLEVHAFVIMPDHIHLLLTPAPDVSLEKAMQFVKGGFSFRLNSKMDVWEKSFTEHRVKDSIDYTNHREYIEQNPVAERLSSTAKRYPHSSAADSSWLVRTPPQLDHRRG